MKTVLIIGNSRIANETATALAALDFNVIIADMDHRNPPRAETLSRPDDTVVRLPGADIITCTGSVGNFDILLSSQKQRFSRRVATVIIAPEHLVQPNFSLYGLTPSPFVFTASDFFARLTASPPDDRPEIAGKQIVFLSGLANQSNPVVASDIMQHCLLLQTSFNCRTYIFTSQLKVAGSGLEALYHQAKKAGTVFIKSTHSLPHFRQDKAGQVKIEYLDEVIRERFEISPAFTVVDETLLPSVQLASLAAIFRLEVDRQGYLQGDNVHRRGVCTNRKGILVAGPARAIQRPDEQAVDVDNCIAATAALSAETGPAVQLDLAKCIHCLTCYRICPYRAVVPIPRVTIAAEACEGCGICIAECPRGAISYESINISESISAIPAAPRISAASDFRPHLMAFCCRRSAMEAYRMAVHLGSPRPRNLSVIELPCAGALSARHIYNAFSHKADGVLVLTCHPDNCHAQAGNSLANDKVNRITAWFAQIGFAPDRLQIKTVAANMGAHLAYTINRFEKKIMALGPSPL